ncbi:arginase family protein, partial [Candidatus Micrarchaeota archaeon]|nr:arginase family protein [Candidatus Micrarchaeota archaeon]
MKKILYSQDPENFAGLQDEYSDYKKSKIIVFPIPFDSTASNQAGQRNAPREIIHESVKLELFDEETKTEVWKKGICTTEYMEPVRGSVEENNKRIQKTIREFLDDGKFVVSLGGDHSITTGVLNAFNEKTGKNFSVLQLDAHSDLHEEFEGSKYSHACIANNALKQAKSVVQVG